MCITMPGVYSAGGQSQSLLHASQACCLLIDLHPQAPQLLFRQNRHRTAVKRAQETVMKRPWSCVLSKLPSGLSSGAGILGRAPPPNRIIYVLIRWGI